MPAKPRIMWLICVVAGPEPGAVDRPHSAETPARVPDQPESRYRGPGRCGRRRSLYFRASLTTFFGMDIAHPQDLLRPLLRAGAGAAIIIGIGILINGAGQIVGQTHNILNDLPAPGALEIIKADEPTVFEPVIDFAADITMPASGDQMLPTR